ncbi:MAG TPA: translocation/assembly module TamB domain-containing protein, partial [Planctomycetaceae bacterium]
MTRLRGTLETQAVRLRAPASIRWSRDGFQTDTVELAVAGGGLRLSAEREADAIAATASATALPAALAALIEPRLDLAGRVSGQLRVAGPLRQPSIDLALTAEGVRPRDMRQEDFAGLSLTADLRQGADGTRLRLTAKGAQSTTATAELTGPALVSLDPLRAALPPEARIDGRIEAAGRLDQLDRIVGLGADRLGGRIAATARLSGTLAQPELEGEMTLAEGMYEGVATGTVIRNASARVTFTGNEARLASFSAGDGNGGSLSGSGTLAFGSPSAAISNLTVRLDRFAALRRPEIDLLATGVLALRGRLQAPKLAGTLSVDRAEFRIPDRLPEDVI